MQGDLSFNSKGFCIGFGNLLRHHRVMGRLCRDDDLTSYAKPFNARRTTRVADELRQSCDLLL